jgi:uncharacterized membrane protein
MVFLAFYLAIRTFEYFSFREDINFLLVREELIKQWPWKLSFYLHISGALVALAVGSVQFWPGMRMRYLRLHKMLGKLYALGIAIAAPAGLYMAVFARGGTFAQIGFVCMDLVWIYTTYRGVHAIMVEKNMREHRDWITRSYAVTFAAVTLRLWVPVLSLGLAMTEVEVLSLTPWLSWLPNLIVAELILLYKDKRNS